MVSSRDGTVFGHNACVKLLRQSGYVFHSLEPHHGLFVLTLNLRTPEMKVQPVTRIA